MGCGSRRCDRCGKCGITDLINASWGTSLADTGKWMLESKFWIWPTAILTAANIDLDRSIDLADLLRRYLFGVRESDNSTMRETLRFEVSDAVDAVAAGAKTDVTIVAHSFGCVMALDYIAASSPVKRIDLFTLGGFLKFLSAENPQLVQPLISGALASPSLAKWTDFYSPNDWLATTTPIVTPSRNMSPGRRSARYRGPIACLASLISTILTILRSSMRCWKAQP